MSVKCDDLNIGIVLTGKKGPEGKSACWTWVRIFSTNMESWVWLYASANSTLWGEETGGLLWLAGHQPSFGFGERPCLKGIG